MVGHGAAGGWRRCEVVERRSRDALEKARARLHIVQGFLRALANIDAVVKVGAFTWDGVGGSMQGGVGDDAGAFGWVSRQGGSSDQCWRWCKHMTLAETDRQGGSPGRGHV